MPDDLQYKRFTLEMKGEGEGEAGLATARFATLNVRDHDGDVTLPGAFGKQTVLLSDWAHDSRSPSIGRADIREEGDQALGDIRFNLKMMRGNEAYQSIAMSQELQEWSYAYQIPEGGAYQGDFEGQQVRFLKTIKVIHLSPVEQGAGIGTATLDIKCANCRTDDSAESVSETVMQVELGTDVLEQAVKEMADTATQTGECPVCGNHIEAKSEPEPQPDPWLEYSSYRMEMLHRKAFVLALIHRRTACRRPAEETKECASESGIMVLKQKTGPRKGAPDRCYHVTTPTGSKSPSTTTAWWPMPG